MVRGCLVRLNGDFIADNDALDKEKNQKALPVLNNLFVTHVSIFSQNVAHAAATSFAFNFALPFLIIHSL